MEEDDPPQVFQWQLPEGAPEPAGVPPLLNGFHEDREDELVGALHAAFAGFGQPPAADGQPDYCQPPPVLGVCVNSQYNSQNSSSFLISAVILLCTCPCA